MSFPSECAALTKELKEKDKDHRVWFVWAKSSKRILRGDPEVLIHQDAMNWLDRYLRAGYQIEKRGDLDWSLRESLQNL